MLCRLGIHKINLQEFNTFEPKDGLARFPVRRHRKCFDFKKFTQNLEVMPKCTRLKKKQPCATPPMSKNTFSRPKKHLYVLSQKQNICKTNQNIHLYIGDFFVSIRLVELTKVCYKFDTLDLALGVSPTSWT